MKPRANAIGVALLVCAALLLGPSASFAQYCPNVDFDECGKCGDCTPHTAHPSGMVVQSPSSAAGNPSLISDPVMLSTGMTRVDDLDLILPSTGLELRRYYTSTEATWDKSVFSGAGPNLAGLPKPFGGTGLGSPGLSAGSLRWWHNWYSFVSVWGTRVQVMAPGGPLYEFDYNPTPLARQNPRRPSEHSPVLVYESATTFVLFYKDGTRMVFDAQWAGGSGANSTTRYFLSQVLDGAGVPIATLVYGQPIDAWGGPPPPCPGWMGTNYVPYLSTITDREGAVLRFTYKVTPEAECVIEDVQILDRATGQFSRELEYGVSKDPNPGGTNALLSSKWYGVAPRTLFYGYGPTYFAAGTGWYPTADPQAYQDPLFRHDYLSHYVITSQSREDSDYLTISGAGGLTVPYVNQNAFSGADANLLVHPTTQAIKTQDLTDGHNKVTQRSESCTDCGSSYSPGTVNFLYSMPSGTTPITPDRMSYSYGVAKKRGSAGGFLEEVLSVRRPSAGQTQFHLEPTDKFTGQRSLASYLTKESYTYEYGSQQLVFPVKAQTYDDQRLRTVSKQSIVNTGANTTTTYYWQSPAKRRLESVVRTGYTQDINGNAVLKRIATLYRYDAQDRLTLEEGPCFVTQTPDAPIACDPGQQTIWPVTGHAYYPNSPGTNDANRPSSVTRYPSGAGAAGLATVFSNYTSLGGAQTIADPNGKAMQVTYLPYDPTRIRSIQIGNLFWLYEYTASGKLKSVQYPEGNFEVYCWRNHTSLGATNHNPTEGSCPNCTVVYNQCEGGAETDRLQWKAKSNNQQGYPFAEKVRYLYYQDGTVFREEYLDASGAIRSVKRYAADAQKRQTFLHWGAAPGEYSAANGFDANDNLARAGAPYNAPPPFCLSADGTFSTSCSQFTFDEADRLVTTALNVSSTDAAPTKNCFTYDAHGNISRLISGCKTTSTSCDATCGGTAATYRFDDFGNLLSATLPGTQEGGAAAPGTIRFEYDAVGHPVKSQTPQQRLDQIYATYTRDGLSRELAAATYGTSSGQSSTMHTRAYDNAKVSPPGCPVPINTMGQMLVRNDALGATWYSYDDLGHVAMEYRLRPNATSCVTGSSPDTVPATAYTYTGNGNPSTIAYPHGQFVTYHYYADNGLNDRVQGIGIRLWQGGTWRNYTVIANVFWEPYGDVAGFDTKTPSSMPLTAAIEYLTGGNGSVAPASPVNCSYSRPSLTSSDLTGRKRALYVSRASILDAEGDRPGDIFKQLYTWNADQLAEKDTCLLSASADLARVEQFTYDRALELRHAASPSSNQTSVTGGAYVLRDYGYDGRGNRTSQTDDGCGYGFSYLNDYGTPVGSFADLMTGRWSSCSWSGLRYAYSYDHDGRVYQRTAPSDSGGDHGLFFRYLPEHPGVFKSVCRDGTNCYSYYYDLFGRRGQKSYPAVGVSDEYYYDTGHQLLEDRGVAGALQAQAPYPIDEYVWLAGRPVALVRGSLDGNLARREDAIGACSRLADGAPCGIYFIVTDYLGRPILLLDSNRRVAGAADYDPFGFPNRVSYHGDSTHPYPNSAGSTMAWLSQPPGRNAVARLRGRFHTIDTEAAGSYAYDYAFMTNSGGAQLSEKIGGWHRGPSVSDWVSIPSDGAVQVRFRSDGDNCCPLAGGGINCSAATCLSYPAFPYKGVGLEAFDYQRYETGASPVWTPLRFPGQYYDEETDLFENWNRYYDPSIGRYLQPEPMLPVGAHLGAAYAYAANNPIKFTDPDGRYILEGECPNFSRAIKMARERAGCEANSDAKACKCNKALLCNICDYLDDSSLPRVRPEAMPVEKEKKCFWGGLICLTVKTITTQGRTSPRDGWAEVWVNKDLCEGENNVAELAKTLLHEALHVCVIHARVPGAADEGRVTDAANQCF